tara:strand:- start:2406 stop:3113 length:708 start_codon:yes stop_codon:yes gene_type:complete
MKVSIFLNTRKRVNLLNNMLISLYNTVSDADNIEVIVTIDNDDKESEQFLESAELKNLTVRKIDKPSNLHTSINEMANIASGDFLFVLNDDVLFRTFHWEKTLIENHDPNEIAYIGTIDNSIDKTSSSRYASFPILTRAAYESLGFFMSEKFVSHGGDVHLWRIFNDVGCVKYAPIFLDHVLHSTKQGLEALQSEETGQEAIKMTYESFVDCWKEDISKEVNLLKESLSEKSNSL